ncbi:MAG: TIGR02206 family membrane protein [Proteobacteria bacterium]|nr:TIGR02206 family membrane protein [Pseudomonadota bacterium]
MNELILLSPSHIITVLLSMLAIIFIPKYFKLSNEMAQKNLRFVIIFLLLVNQAMDFYREGVMSDRWQDGLPLHLCDFSTMVVFAFFFGIAGGGMSILTPDTVYGFPYVGYIQSQIGHTMILMGVTYAMVIDNQRPFLKDIPKVFMYATVLLLFTYLMNYLLGTNYWFLAEKPIGDNITALMRPEPFHIIDLYIVALLVCYSMYLPFYLKDRKLS